MVNLMINDFNNENSHLNKLMSMIIVKQRRSKYSAFAVAKISCFTDALSSSAKQ